MELNLPDIGKKDKQKLIRLSEQTERYLEIIAKKTKTSKTDVINILINNVGKELEFIKKCEDYLEDLNKKYDEENKNQSISTINFNNKEFPTIRVIQYPKFLGVCSNTFSNDNKNNIFNASEHLDIYISRSLDKNFKYFVNFQKGISKIINPNTYSYEDHTDIFYTSDFVNDLYSYFKEKNINVQNLILDKNFKNMVR